MNIQKCDYIYFDRDSTDILIAKMYTEEMMRRDAAIGGEWASDDFMKIATEYFYAALGEASKISDERVRHLVNLGSGRMTDIKKFYKTPQDD